MIMTPAELQEARAAVEAAVNVARTEAERQIFQVMKNLERCIGPMALGVQLNTVDVTPISSNRRVRVLSSVSIQLQGDA